MRSLRSVSWLVLAALPHAPALAQTIDWAGGDGPWNDAARWSPANVPNNTAETARLAGLGVYTVTLTGGFTIDAFEILNTSATLHITNNSSLAAHGTLLRNNGQLRVNNAAGMNFTSIQTLTATTLSGPGVINLQATASNLDTADLDSVGGAITTQGPDHRVWGTRRIYTPMTNLGSIAATVPGRSLEIRSAISNLGEERPAADARPRLAHRLSAQPSAHPPDLPRRLQRRLRGRQRRLRHVRRLVQHLRLHRPDHVTDLPGRPQPRRLCRSR